MQTKVLIIGYVWLETTSAAGNRILQLINFFKQQNCKITFATPAQKTVNSLDLSLLDVDEVSIELNNISFNNFIKKLNPNIVLFDRFMIEEQFGWRVTENCPNALRILDTEDLHFLRKVRHQQLKKDLDFTNEALLNSDDTKREIASILRCDLSLIISTYEMELLKSVFKIDKNLLYHLPFLLDNINEKVIASWVPFEKREHFVFVGNFLHQPNIDAVLQLKSIWKNIKNKLPKAKLCIYGAYATQQIEQLENRNEDFIIKGFAENIEKVIQNSRVVLAPIRFGAGIKGKLTEAMLCGTPSVTTSIGAEGMYANLDWNGFITDDFNEFAIKAVALYSDEKAWKKSQQNGVKIINNLYNKTKLAKPFYKSILELQQNLELHRNKNFIGRLLNYKTLQATKYMSKWIEEKNK